jgi:hypothetical protein
MSGETGPITAEGKEVSKKNAVKHGLYLDFSDFFPCNLCTLRETCPDFEQGGICKIDKKEFNELLSEDLDTIKACEALIKYNLVRLSRATQQLKKRPDHLELTRISAEIRQELQTLFIMKSRGFESAGPNK